MSAVRTMRRLRPEHFRTYATQASNPGRADLRHASFVLLLTRVSLALDRPHATFPCSGQYAGGRTAVLRYVEWAIAALERPAARTPIRVALGDPALDDQGLLIAYWLAQPLNTVVVDAHCLLFCPLARWYVLGSELQAGRASPYADRAVPWCGELDAGPRRFSEGIGHFCSDGYNLEGFQRRCSDAAEGRRCELVATSWWPARTCERCELTYAEPDGGAALRPLLGWHGPGHNGKTLFRPLWKRLRTNYWSTAANASALATPTAGVCGVTSLGEGDCHRGWWGAWRASDYGLTLKGTHGQAACLSLCRQCARCAYVSWSEQADECAWYAQCALPLQHAPGFQSVAAPWSVSPPHTRHITPPATSADKTRAGVGGGQLSRGVACQPKRCASIEVEANCSFSMPFAARFYSGAHPPFAKAVGRHPFRRPCSPHILRQHAPTTTGLLHQWLGSCAPGCRVGRRAVAAAEAEAVQGPLDETGARACRPLAGGAPVHLWAMVSVMQNDLLDHFLQHYTDLGIDLARRATFALHVPPDSEALLNATRALLAARGVDVLRGVSVVAKYTTVYKKQLVNAHLASLPADALLVYPDVDEFFEYPCDVLATLATGRHHATCATMVDRLGSGAVLAPLRPSPAIEQQFTLCAEVRGGVLSREACLLKITLLPARIRGAVPRFATSHRATATLASGATLTVGGCMSWGEACLFTGGFAHYQFYAQSVDFQVRK